MNKNLHFLSLCSARKTTTGESLKLHDAEMKILASGPIGMQRLAAMRALDLQENIPDLSSEDAQKMGAGYVILKVLSVNGSLTASTRSEVQRLEAKE